MRKARNVAVIGAGVAGLSAAALLSRRGLNVQIFEANSKVGGCCATTTIEGYTFNDGALYLAMPALLDHVFEKLGLSRPSSLPLRRITANQTTTLPDGSVVTIGNGLDIRVETGGSNVDHTRLREELDTFMTKWEPVLQFVAEEVLLHPLSLARFLRGGWRHLHKMRGTVVSELSASFSSEAVRSALSGTLLYTGCPPENSPAFMLIGLVAMLRDGLLLPEGGMGRLPETLSRAVLDNGGTIHCDSKVSRILVKEGRVRGIEGPGSGLIEFDAVISTVSGMHTFGTLLDPSVVPGSLRRKVRQAGLSHKGFVIQLGLANKINAPSHCNAVLPRMQDQAELFRSGEDNVRWPIYMVPTVTMPELAPPGGSIVEMYPAIDQRVAAADWSDGRKEHVAGLAVRALKQRHGLDMVVRRILSPKEFQETLHLYHGALYGLSPVGSPGRLYSHRSRIPGLYQAGQTTWPGFGVGPSAISGILAAESLIGA